MKARNYGKVTILALTLIMALSLVLTGCGKSDEVTLESYIKDHKDYQEQIDKEIGDLGDGMKAEVSFEENTMIMTVSVDEMIQDMLGADFEMTDEYKQVFADALGSEFDSGTTHDQLVEALGQIQEEVGCGKVSLEINVTYDGDTIWSGTVSQE